tara:strand:+ start:33 stop:278 length:246 start_codon:yes stop_codon:yes gene_type:complete
MFLTLVIIIVLILFLVLFSKQNLNVNQNGDKAFNINKWMSMSGKERNYYDTKDKETTMKRKKRLLTKIRKEYQSAVTKLRK